jgi:hypothetical protein
MRHPPTPARRVVLALSAAVLLSRLPSAQQEVALTLPAGTWQVSGGAPDGEEARMMDMPGRDAPAGVMGAMMHDPGEWMLGLRVMRMHMDGVVDGHSHVSDGELFGAGYTMIPRQMDSTSTMLEAMYGLSDGLTVMASLPYVTNTMDMRMDTGEKFTMDSRGIGDLQLAALLGLYDDGEEEVHFNAGLSVPTGSVDETDDTPGFPGGKVDYPMQPGSGTWDLMPGVTWVARDGEWSWGAQWIETWRLGENSEDYTYGNRHDVTAWGARSLTDVLSLSLRLAGHDWGNVDGADPDLDPTMSPTQDPNKQGGRRVDALLGVSAAPRDGALTGNRFALELGLPVYEKIDGPQLSTDWIATFSWQLWF